MTREEHAALPYIEDYLKSLSFGSRHINLMGIYPQNILQNP